MSIFNSSLVYRPALPIQWIILITIGRMPNIDRYWGVGDIISWPPSPGLRDSEISKKHKAVAAIGRNSVSVLRTEQIMNGDITYKN